MACKCCPNYWSFFPGDPPMTVMMACEGNAFRITGPGHFMNYKSNIVLCWHVFLVNQILHDVLPSHRSLIAFIWRLISLRHFRRSPKSILSFWFNPNTNASIWCLQITSYAVVVNATARNNVIPKNANTLRWRHNDHTGVSNHQPHGCLLNRLFRRRSKKTWKLRVTGICVGNSPGPVNSPHKGPVTRKMLPFDDVIMIRKSEI